MISLILTLFLQCGGCEPRVLSSQDTDMRAGITAINILSKDSTFIVTQLDAASNGICGPDFGTTCSKQYDTAKITASVLGFCEPNKFCAVSYTGGGVVILPSGAFNWSDLLETDCKLRGDTFNIYIFDISTFEIYGEGFIRFWATQCPKPN